MFVLCLNLFDVSLLSKNIILGTFISIATFPGVIIHEFSHEFFCRLLGVKVKKVCYFRFGNPAGYVLHEQSKFFYQAFLIAIGPFLLGTFLTTMSFRIGNHENFVRNVVWIWLGISVAFNCFPSRGDSKSLWLENWSHLKRNVFAVLGLPFTLFVWAISLLDSLALRILYVVFLFYVNIFLM